MPLTLPQIKEVVKDYINHCDADEFEEIVQQCADIAARTHDTPELDQTWGKAAIHLSIAANYIHNRRGN